ncbi:hypothetical protein IW262DRAFT_1424820 [Armillaria fumosa]|nr:hypothetical protein IW262DRAFT_1424820 [Armillaria fumosa]
MDSTEPPPTTTADPPFNDASDFADLVIRTSDNVDFFVHRSFLLLKSPSSFFRNALYGNHHTEEKDGLPVLEVVEDSAIFKSILLFCYPYDTPELASVEHFSAVGMALDKYCMDHAFERFVQTVIGSLLIKGQPLRVFAVAIANRWKALGETAARNTLGVPLDGVESDVKELDGISARHLQRLLNYHKRCGKITQFSWVPWLGKEQPGCKPLQLSSKCLRCQEKLSADAYMFEGKMLFVYSHPWLRDSYLDPVKKKMLVDPRPQVAFDDAIIRGAILASIKECSNDSWIRDASSQIHKLAQLVAAEIEKLCAGNCKYLQVIVSILRYSKQMNIYAKLFSKTTANAPFNDPTDNVDLVIRTADNVDFFVLSALLSLRSPSSFFRQVLLGNTNTEERDGFPVLEVKENSDIFRTILLFCYPYDTPEITSVQQIMELGAALDKYCMDQAMERFIAAVLASSVISKQPLRVFALAVANRWKQVGEAAARNTLDRVISDVEELKEISARHLYRLKDYHARCREAAHTPLPWLGGQTSGLQFLHHDFAKCQWCNGRITFVAYGEDVDLYSHTWLTDIYFRLVNAKVLSSPLPQAALDDYIIDQAVLASTKQCRRDQWSEIADSQIRRLGKIVAEEINRRISEVPLDIEW